MIHPRLGSPTSSFPAQECRQVRRAGGQQQLPEMQTQRCWTCCDLKALPLPSPLGWGWDRRPGLWHLSTGIRFRLQNVFPRRPLESRCEMRVGHSSRPAWPSHGPSVLLKRATPQFADSTEQYSKKKGPLLLKAAAGWVSKSGSRGKEDKNSKHAA